MGDLERYEPQKTGKELINEIKQIGAQGTYGCGIRLREIKEKKLYEGFAGTFVDFCHQEGLEWKATHLNELVYYVNIIDNLFARAKDLLTGFPQEKVIRPLKKLPSPEAQREVWSEFDYAPTHEQVERAVERWQVNNEQPKTKQGPPTKLVCNWTTDKIDWAKWSWNPVFGCKHGCQYCYARDFARRQRRDFDTPEIMIHKLLCPKNTNVPKFKQDEPGVHNVFVCSMSDLFGEWVPDDWIDKVFNACRDNPQWNYIFLTKNPHRYIGLNWPDTAWVGATIDTQERVSSTIEAFSQFKAPVKFVSFEPLISEIDMQGGLVHFDWVIIGSRSKSSRMPEYKPPWLWVESLLWQARKANCKVYFKPNLSNYGPKEYPVREK